MIGANVPYADIVGHDYEDVGFLLERCRRRNRHRDAGYTRSQHAVLYEAAQTHFSTSPEKHLHKQNRDDAPRCTTTEHASARASSRSSSSIGPRFPRWRRRSSESGFNRHPPHGRRFQTNLRPFRALGKPGPPAGPPPARWLKAARRAEVKSTGEKRRTLRDQDAFSCRF